jgi:hypothetical protein
MGCKSRVVRINLDIHKLVHTLITHLLYNCSYVLVSNK